MGFKRFKIKQSSQINKLTTDANWVQQCYGMSADELFEYLNMNLRMTFEEDEHKAKQSLSLSMLSDVQEMIARGMSEDARQLINRVKYLLHCELEELKEPAS